jgi:hypothetical protein
VLELAADAEGRIEHAGVETRGSDVRAVPDCRRRHPRPAGDDDAAGGIDDDPRRLVAPAAEVDRDRTTDAEGRVERAVVSS